ncbi:hypothetical protein E2C01_082876 [Portunus trituberculatus]|uniref:Uncharacterized protein n=1 Tax=Portunus trituberculatus TaxID=210409 RepID=A0A5B7J4Y3_PORTR|nr:hypothetical protein [Portunus trituberculatus]
MHQRDLTQENLTKTSELDRTPPLEVSRYWKGWRSIELSHHHISASSVVADGTDHLYTTSIHRHYYQPVQNQGTETSNTLSYDTHHGEATQAITKDSPHLSASTRTKAPVSDETARTERAQSSLYPIFGEV